MLLGQVVTLQELENMLLKSEREYLKRKSEIQYEHSLIEKSIKDINQYSYVGGRRYVTDEYREAYYKISDLRDELESVEESIHFFRERISELENYEDRMRRAGMYVKKEEEEYTLYPRDYEQFNRYSEQYKKTEEVIGEQEKKKETTKAATKTTPKATPKSTPKTASKEKEEVVQEELNLEEK